MTPDELDNAFVRVRDELKLTSYEARQKAEDEIREHISFLEVVICAAAVNKKRRET